MITKKEPSQKHVVVVVDGVPHCYHGGGGVTAYAIVSSLLSRGHSVSVIALASSSHAGGIPEKQHIQHLQAKGVEVVVLDEQAVHQQGNAYTKYVKWDLMPGYEKNLSVRRITSSLRPNAIIAYHWAPLAAVHGYHDCIKVGLVGDPIHLPALYRRNIGRYVSFFGKIKSRIRNSARDLIVSTKQQKGMKRLLADCTVCGAFAAHHAQLFRKSGVHNCRYFRTPVPDPLKMPIHTQKSSKFKIMHIGHLQGTATLSGVEVLAYEILPYLERSLPIDAFEIHLVGGYFETMPHSFQQRLTHPNVIVRGQISPADDEFLSSHVILVPTPIELGIRVRIITAFSFGSCVVAHRANAKGIPELVHGENCLLGDDGKALGEACTMLFHDHQLRVRLEGNSRRTYDKYFSLVAAGGAIVDTLDSI